MHLVEDTGGVCLLHLIQNRSPESTIDAIFHVCPLQLDQGDYCLQGTAIVIMSFSIFNNHSLWDEFEVVRLYITG